MNKEFNGFDEMVEALEENEDMVECKECFDLVPKVDCERAEVGYICPTCKGLRTAPAQARFVDPYDSYTQDFPEVTEYDPDSVVEYEKEPGLGDALSDLIRDEYEAIEGYEVADETIQHAAIEENEKDEILDTLDHIKEEEEEHIDELKELCPECDPVAEPEAESEKLEEAADDEVADEEAEVEEISEEDAEESEENENEEVSDLESAYEAALEVANESGVGQVFGYARKETEEFVAIEPFEVDDPEAVEDDLMAVYDDVAYAYVVYPEKELEESLFEGVQLNEGIFDKSAKIFNAIAAKGFEVVASPVPADNANAKLKSGQKFNKGEYDKAKKFAQMASSITKTSLWGIKIVEPEAALKEAGLTDASLLNLLKENKNILTVYKAGKETVNNKTFLKDLATILKSHKLASKLGITDTAAGRDAFETETETEPKSKSDIEPEPKPESETVIETEPKTETDTIETETPPETPAAEPAEDTKKADQAKRIKDGFKTLGKDLSDEAVEKLRAILFAESYHVPLTEDVAPADFPGTWRNNLLFVYKAENTSGASGFAVAFPKESGIRGYAAIAAEIAAGKYTEDSAKAYEEKINGFVNDTTVTPNTAGATIDQWSANCNAYFKEAEDLLKPATASETTAATSDASGATPEAPAAKAGKMSTQQMSQMRANQKKIYNAIVSDPELKDLAAKLYVDGTNKAGKKVKKATPELKALRKAIFGESFDAEVNEELQSNVE